MKIWNVLTLLSSSTSTGLHVFQNVAYYYMIVLFISWGCGGMGRGGGFGRWVGGGVIAFLILRYSLFVYMKWHSRTFVSVSRTSVRPVHPPTSVTVKHPSIPCPTNSCSHKHTNMYCMAKEQFENIWGKKSSNFWQQNFKNEDTGKNVPPQQKRKGKNGTSSPANTMKTVFRIPSSWGFVQFVQDAMLTKHCEGGESIDDSTWKCLFRQGPRGSMWSRYSLNMPILLLCFVSLQQLLGHTEGVPCVQQTSAWAEEHKLAKIAFIKSFLSILSTWPPTSLIRLIRGLFSHGNELARREAAKLGRWNLLCRLERTVRSSSSLVSSSLFTSSLNWPLGRHHQHQCLCRTITLTEFKVFYHRSLAGAAHDGVPQT